jgi:hypothetical protein
MSLPATGSPEALRKIPTGAPEASPRISPTGSPSTSRRGSAPSSILASGGAGATPTSITPPAGSGKGVGSKLWSWLSIPFKVITVPLNALKNIFRYFIPDYKTIHTQLNEVSRNMGNSSYDKKSYAQLPRWVKRGLESQWKTDRCAGIFSDGITDAAISDACRQCLSKFHEVKIAPKLPKTSK